PAASAQLNPPEAPEVESFEWLGTFDGASATGYSINSYGAVAGRAFPPSWVGGWYAFTVINGQGQFYKAPSGYTNSGEAINESGVAVGYKSNLESGDWVHRATAWGGSTLMNGDKSQAFGINVEGIVTGYVQSSDTRTAFRWDPNGGDDDDLELLSGIPAWPQGSALNDVGQIAGVWYTPDSPAASIFVIGADNEINFLPPVGGDPEVAAINEAGHVVGIAHSSGLAPSYAF